MRVHRSGLPLVRVAAIALLVACAGPAPAASTAAASTPRITPPAATQSARASAVAASPPASSVATASPTGAATAPTSIPSAAPASPIATAPGSEPASGPTFEQLIGQKLVVLMSGHKPDANLLARIKRGEIGGIILVGANITTKSALISLTGKLQASAAAGGQPRLMIAIDQEGGEVKRISWAPPTITVPEMGHENRTSVARSQGAQTGSALRGLGINVNFAPVADIPRSTSSFMYQQGRTFSMTATVTARMTNAFALGLEAEGVQATMKHFPGIGLAIQNTDHYADTITASNATLQTDLSPYRKAIAHGLPMIMLSNATYTAYDSNNAAGWSYAIATTLLRHDLGFTGVSITDSLSGTAHSRGTSVKALAFKSAVAGVDMILMTGTEKTSRNLYATLLGQARNGSIPYATLKASYDRIIALKAGL